MSCVQLRQFRELCHVSDQIPIYGPIDHRRCMLDGGDLVLFVLGIDHCHLSWGASICRNNSDTSVTGKTVKFRQTPRKKNMHNRTTKQALLGGWACHEVMLASL